MESWKRQVQKFLPDWFYNWLLIHQWWWAQCNNHLSDHLLKLLDCLRWEFLLPQLWRHQYNLIFSAYAVLTPLHPNYSFHLWGHPLLKSGFLEWRQSWIYHKWIPEQIVGSRKGKSAPGWRRQPWQTFLLHCQNLHPQILYWDFSLPFPEIAF